LKFLLQIRIQITRLIRYEVRKEIGM